MKIVDLQEEFLSHYLLCMEEWSDTMQTARPLKENWYARMKNEGLRVRIAVNDDDIVAGMIEYMPIEHSYAEGKGLYIINCVWVHGHDEGRGNLQGKGLGKALLKAAEKDVRALGAGGLAAWGISQPFWMTAAWFEKHGYKKVDQDGIMVLLWKRFSKGAKPPRWIRGEFTQEPAEGKVKVTSFFSGQCPSENGTHLSARKAAEEFGDRVVFEEIDMSLPENRRRYGLKGGLYVNGTNIFAGPPPTYRQIREKIEEALAAL